MTDVPTCPLLGLKLMTTGKPKSQAEVMFQTVTPVFTNKTAEKYQQRAFQSLKAALEKTSSQN
jgi:hypothetical protein